MDKAVENQMDKAAHWYLHVDLDAFFASVEQLDNPEYRGKPVIVGGKPEDRRSVVSTASYEARVFGVHSAMPTFQAYKLCPQGIFVHGRMHRYAELSHQIMTIFRDYSPDVDQMSIDEAFIDLTGTEKLFGPPEETARAIKARVKEETGLTVSVGLATTKYLAKIASGLSKPDGFYHIKSGQEESFMLQLPLNKVWGLGPKSLELIRSKGFRSTRDLYEKDYDTLEFLFGKNMAGFLYNVVRGIEKESFTRESKSHSISAENTFPYDLTDIYTIETELLELAHGVFFRLLKEEGYSRTAFVKIRYEDFSTCTVQETLERNIITLDSYFEIIKRLFEKRYENGRGIRLLGVGFENIVKEEKPYQQDLFSDNRDEKKQAVEKAILGLSKKHPEIKVSKARTLKAILLVFLIGALPSQAKAEETGTVEAVEEAATSASLFDYEIDDKNHVEFTANGLWKADLESGVNFTFGNDTDFAASPIVPVFKQETDIAALLTLNQRWYFEAAFADEFTRNTLAFGYKGPNLVRSFRLANRGVTMAQGYSAEHFGYALRGGSNQAPGASLQLISPSEKLQADFLVRYDMTESKSALYYGMNKVNESSLNAASFAYGREFRFPEECGPLLYDISGVYVENENGSYKDARSRKYKKLSRDQYAVLAGEPAAPAPRLFLSAGAGGGLTATSEIPSILITFTSSSAVAELTAAAGSYTNPGSYLGKIQQELGCSGSYQLTDYSYELTTELDGSPALIIQNYEGFSPFLVADLYDFGTNKNADYLVIADKSEIPVTKYKAAQSEDLYTSLYENLFDKPQSSVKITNREKAQSPYPFASDYPEIYLGIKNEVPLSIRARSYSPVTEILISKKAAAGTVQVYKNGSLIPGAVFNENTGVVQLNTAVADTDEILVTWQEEADDFSSGAVAAAAGLKVNFLPGLNADFSLTARQPLTFEPEYARAGSQKNSFAAFTSGLSFEREGFTIKEKAAISLLNDNTTEGLSIYSWEKLYEEYEKEKSQNPDSKITKPEKASLVRFKSQDFSAYKKINLKLRFVKEAGSTFTGPLLLLLDTDTGSSAAGSEALYLFIKDIKDITGSSDTSDEVTSTIKIDTEEKKVFIDGSPLSSDCYELRLHKEVLPSRLTLECSGQSAGQSGGQKALIEELDFEEARTYATLRNYTALEYKKEGSLVEIGDFALIKDLQLSAESDQGSGNLLEPEPFVTSKAQAKATVSGLALSADAALQTLKENTSLTEAGHSIKTDGSILPFRIISAEDTYRYKASAKEVRKENNFGLDLSAVKLPLKTVFNTKADASAFREKQNALLSADFSHKLSDFDLGLGAKLEVSQKLSRKPEDNPFIKGQLPDYGQSWLEISELEFSSGKKAADSRDSLWSACLGAGAPLGQSGITLKPKLTYELSDIYTSQAESKTNAALFTDKEYMQLLLPFSMEKKAINFEISRTGGATESLDLADTVYTDGDYAKDSQKLFELQKQRDWFYSSIPFYELFDRELKEKISGAYAAKYEGSFKRSLYNSIKDLYIPSGLTLGISREIKNQKPQSDIYQFKAVIINNSINNLGSNSRGKYFTFFQQEELTTNLTALLKIPAEEPENFRLKIQTYAQALLFIREKTILTEQLDFAIENTADWNIRDTISWTRPSQTSLLTALVKLFTDEAPGGLSISRKDSFTAEAGKINAVLQQKYSYNHTVGIDFLEYYNINAGIGGSLTLNQKKADSLSINVSLGAKAEFK